MQTDSPESLPPCIVVAQEKGGREYARRRIRIKTSALARSSRAGRICPRDGSMRNPCRRSVCTRIASSRREWQRTARRPVRLPRSHGELRRLPGMRASLPESTWNVGRRARPTQSGGLHGRQRIRSPYFHLMHALRGSLVCPSMPGGRYRKGGRRHCDRESGSVHRLQILLSGVPF